MSLPDTSIIYEDWKRSQAVESWHFIATPKAEDVLHHHEPYMTQGGSEAIPGIRVFPNFLMGVLLIKGPVDSSTKAGWP